MLLINNDDVARLLTITDCIEAIEDAYREWGLGRAAQFPPEGRMDLSAPSPGPEKDRRFTWGAMAGVVSKHGMFALRQKLDIHYRIEHPGGIETTEKFCVEPGTFCGIILLVSTRNAEPLAIVNDGVLQHHRVAATAAVASRYLARSNSKTLGMIGSGGMARSHVAAVAAVHGIDRVRVFSMTPANRERFADEMSEELGLQIEAVSSPEDAVAGADIVTLCTDSVTPIFADTSWIEPGMTITAVLPSEIGEGSDRADVVILHERGGEVGVAASSEEVTLSADVASRMPRARLLQHRTDLPTLAELVAGQVPGRTQPDQVTYYHNIPGSGIQFAAVGARLYELAVEQGVGQEIPTGWFLQDIRN